MGLVKKRYRVYLPNKEGFFTIEVTVVTKFGKKPEVFVDAHGFASVEFIGEEACW